MTDTPSPNPPPAEIRDTGCAPVAITLAALAVIVVAGVVWLFSLLAVTPVLMGVFTAFYALGLIIPFGLVALLLRPPRLGLWRGAALALALAGGYAALSGGLVTLDLALQWGNVPGWVRPLVLLVYGLAIALMVRRRLSAGADAARGAVWLGAALGLIMSAGWVVVGALGTPAELLHAVMEALGAALTAAAISAAIFAFDSAFLSERPFWAAMLTGAVITALVPGLLASRGYMLHGLMLFGALLPVGFVAGALLALGAEPARRGHIGRLVAFFLPLLLLPLAWAEAFEGDWMLEEMATAWAPAVPVSLLAGGVIAVILLVVRRFATRVARRAVLPAGFAAIVLIGVGLLYALAGQPGLQPFSYLVVLEDQANTSFARDLDGQEARYTAVYETLTAHALETQADIRAMLDARGVTYTPYYLVNALEVETFNPLLRGQLERRPDVWKTLDTPRARPLPAFAQPISLSTLVGEEPAPELAWGVDAIDAERVWAEFGVTGEGIVVGIADSGADWQHPALRETYLGADGDHEYRWFDPWEGTTEPIDTGGHGTHTTGTIVGQNGIGVAPGAQWIACRNLGRNLGNPAYYLDCMQFLFAPHPQNGDPLTEGRPELGADLTSNSWGCPPEEGCDGQTLYIGVEHLRNAGQMFVASAGNDGPDCATIGVPATADAAFGVGAVNESGSVTIFSSRGPVLVDGSGRIKPDVVAPGQGVLSSVPGGGYARLDGTSMAGPHVAGLVALLWSANPDLVGDIDATEALITSTADPQSAPDLCGATDGPQNNAYGFGLVDADEAVDLALNGAGN